MAGIIINCSITDEKVEFCGGISNMMKREYENSDFILEYKVSCVSINHKYYVYIEVKVDTSKYVMYILQKGKTLEDRFAGVMIPLDIGLSGFKFNIIGMD